MSHADVWLTVDDLVREYRFASAGAARQWLRRNHLGYVPHGQRAIRVTRANVDAVFNQSRRAKQRSAA